MDRFQFREENERVIIMNGGLNVLPISRERRSPTVSKQANVPAPFVRLQR